MMKTKNGFNQLLEKVRNLGFDIQDNNSTISLEGDNAIDYFNKYYMDSDEKGFILGSVPATTENLDSVEFDVMFNTVEMFHDELSSLEYVQLHSLAEKDDFKLFQSYLENNDSMNEVYMEIYDDIENWKESMYEELNEIIYDLTT